VLYEMLSGDLPFTGDSAVDIAMKQVSDPPPPLHTRNRLVSPAMEQVVMRALAKDPALRFSSARQMAEELARVGRGQSASSDTQQATRVIAADHTRVIPPVEGATSVMRQPQPPERPAPRRSALPWLLVLVLLVLAAVAGFVVYNMLSGSDLSVPQSLVGQTCKQGLQTLQADGLKGKCVNTTSKLADVGKIVATDPPVGSGVSKGSQVTLKVGIGPKSIKVPLLKGQSIVQASSLLQKDGFKVNPTQIIIDSPTASQNFVIGSTPKEGTSQKLGTEVTLKVASGSVKVPSVSGLTCAAAKKALAKVTLQPSCQNRASQAPKNQAYATSLGGVARVAQHTSVTVFISSGPTLVRLPNVRGEPAGQAKIDLHNAGFAVQVHQQVECTDPTQDHIVQSQTPSGPTAPRGSTVEITVTVYRPSDPTCVGPPGST
jgi:beta-lactam-binding protein with PASTA domain